jgi:hypothetical protein
MGHQSRRHCAKHCEEPFRAHRRRASGQGHTRRDTMGSGATFGEEL